MCCVKIQHFLIPSSLSVNCFQNNHRMSPTFCPVKKYGVKYIWQNVDFSLWLIKSNICIYAHKYTSMEIHTIHRSRTIAFYVPSATLDQRRSRELHKLGDDCWLRAKLTFSFELWLWVRVFQWGRRYLAIGSGTWNPTCVLKLSGIVELILNVKS